MLDDKDIARLKEILATKDDLKGFATKDDLKDMAAKSDLKSLASKDDLNKMEKRLGRKFTQLFNFIDKEVMDDRKRINSLERILNPSVS